MTPRKNKVVIIGAGPSGLFAARALQKKGIEPVLLEKEARVGGKCYTYSDASLPDLKTEWGAAMLAPNYGVVLDAVMEKGIEFEESVGTRRETIGIWEKMDGLSLTNKLFFCADLVVQMAKFTYAVTQYHDAKSHADELPEDFELPFTQFAEKYGMQDINLMVKPLVTGFGYGAMTDIPAYCVMEYMGIGTLPAFAAESVFRQSALVGIKGGTQYLMEKVAEDFNVITSADVTHITRSKDNVSVTYTVNGVTTEMNADALVLAVSPLHWAELGLDMTPIEKECVNKLTYYRYPVAVCKVNGLAPEHQFVPEALEKERFGHLALITTRDNREAPQDGRLCTAYVNLPAGDNPYSLSENSSDLIALKNELREKDEVEHVDIIATKIWEDYMPTLPWQQRLQLEQEQMREDTATLYVGAYPLGGFEDIRCVADQATRAVNKHILHEEEQSSLSYAANEVARSFRFFCSVPRVQAVNDAAACRRETQCRT